MSSVANKAFHKNRQNRLKVLYPATNLDKHTKTYAVRTLKLHLITLYGLLF